MDVVENVLEYYKSKKCDFDYILLLEPTSPLRKEGDLDAVIMLAVKNAIADGVVSLGKVHMEHPMIVKRVTEEGKIISYIHDSKKISQRQQADEAFFPYGVAYLIKTEIFRLKKSFYTDNIIPYYLERWQNYEIDDIFDFIAVEAILIKILEEQL
jgi:CMP-N-acetylneuraminic acid synthetase